MAAYARVSAPFLGFPCAPWEPMRIETQLTRFGDAVAKVDYPGIARRQRGSRPLSPLSLPVGTCTTYASELELLPRGILDDLLACDDGPAVIAAPEEFAVARPTTPEYAEAPATAGSTTGLVCHVPDLVRAAGRGDLAEVTRLLASGEDPNGADDYQLTALHGAAKKGHARIVSLLLRHGAKVNASATALHGETPLHYASKYGHAQVARMLLDCGADATAATQDGRTALQYAREKGHAHVARVLAGAGEK